MEPVFILPLPAPEHMPVLGAGLKAVGVKMVEIGAWGGQCDYLNQAHLQAANKMLAYAGVEAYSYHPPFAGRYDISALDMGVWAHAVELNRRHMAAAAALGAKHYVLHPSGRVTDAERALRVKAFRRGLRELVEVAEELELSIAVENLPPGHLGVDIDELMWLVAAGDSERVGVCFDTGHAHLAGFSMGEAIGKIGERLFTIHWHDNDRSRDQHVLPGRGTIDWANFFQALDKLGWDRPVCLEARWDPDMAPEDFVRLARQALAERRAMV